MSVPLLAGKATIVRVYPDASTLSGKMRLRCELAWRRAGGEHYLPMDRSHGPAIHHGWRQALHVAGGDDE